MPEYKVDSRSRPEIQRQDLGPIVNYLAVKWFEEAAGLYNPAHDVNSLNGDGDFTFAYLTLWAQEIYKPVSRLASKYNSSNVQDTDCALNELLQVSLSDTSNYPERIAFTDSFEDLMHKEGLPSGIILPLMAYKAIVWQRTALDRQKIPVQPFNRRDAISVISSRLFHAKLLQAAHTANGIYKSGATDFAYLGGEFNPFDNLGDESFVLEGDKVKLTEAAVASMRRRLTSANSMGSKSQETDGCPVRRTTYPQLGRFALRFAEESGISADELRFPSRSAIVAGCEYVVQCLVALDELAKETTSQPGENLQLVAR